MPRSLPPTRAPHLALLMALALGPGCIVAAMAAGAAGTAYVVGDLETDMEVGPDPLWRALEAALLDLELPILESRLEAGEGFIASRSQENEPIVIALSPNGPDSIHVSIRVGTFGDAALAARIREASLANLSAEIGTTDPAE